MGDDAFLRVSWFLLVGFAVLSVLCFITLVLTRATKDRLEKRRAVRAATIRGHVFDLVMGEDAEVASAQSWLGATRGSRWNHVEQQLFAMLPKLKGDGRAVIIGVLLARGAEQHAVGLSRSRSAVRRCRGTYRLGMLGLGAHFELIVRLLADRKFLVRRVAVRALGNLGDPRAVRPLLVLGQHDNRLARDLVFALGRMGGAVAPELRRVLAEEIDSGEHLHLDPAAAVLGLLGDTDSVEILAVGLRSENPSFAGACAEALGRIGSPEAIPALVEALLDFRPNVRAAAAHALGAVGSSAALSNLIDVVDEEEPQVSRQAAQALLDLGPAARELLERSESAYAVEALALDKIRLGRR